MTFLIIAHDAEGVLEKRQAAREAHLAALKEAVAAKTVTLAGPILDDAGNPAGSALIVEVESREGLEPLLKNDTYTQEGVWERFDIYPFKKVF